MMVFGKKRLLVSLFVAGQLTSSFGQELDFAKSIGSNSLDFFSEQGYSVAVDNEGNVLLTGEGSIGMRLAIGEQNEVTLNSGKGFLAKFAIDGSFEDLEPNAPYVNSPVPNDSNPLRQQKFGSLQIISAKTGQNLTLSPPLPGAGANDVYQWQKSGSDIPGEDNPTLNINSFVLGDTGIYQLIVTNTAVANLTLESELLYLVQDPLEKDSMALVALYNETGGDNWKNNRDWLTSDNLESWFGVTLENGRVARISLSDNNLRGTLPSELSDLTELTKLSIGSNFLTGAIPSSLLNLCLTNLD